MEVLLLFKCFEINRFYLLQVVHIIDGLFTAFFLLFIDFALSDDGAIKVVNNETVLLSLNLNGSRSFAFDNFPELISGFPLGLKAAAFAIIRCILGMFGHLKHMLGVLLTDHLVQVLLVAVLCFFKLPDVIQSDLAILIVKQQEAIILSLFYFKRLHSTGVRNNPESHVICDIA